MMGDPYQVLGVSKDATDDEIKKAYRELAKKYHPDNYADNPLADLAQEKMKEINEAYDTITKQRASGYTPPGSDAGTDNSSTYAGEYIHVRELINAGRFSDAELILDSVVQSDRNAEWNYLKGCVLTQRGWFFDAQKYLETACYLDPTNAEYRNALNSIRANASLYGKNYNTTASTGGCSACNLCYGLICTDCLCECCGGDFINCC